MVLGMSYDNSFEENEENSHYKKQKKGLTKMKNYEQPREDKIKKDVEIKKLRKIKREQFNDSIE